MSLVDEREAALLALVRRLAERARPGEELEAFGVHSVGATVSVFDRDVERLVSAEARGVGVRVVSAGRLGFAATSDLSDDGLAQVVAEARSNAEFGTPDPGNRLPAPAATPPEPVPGLVDGSLADVPVDRKVELALRMERLATSLDPRVTRVQTAGYGDGLSSVAVASSLGVASSYSRSDAYCFAVVLADGSDGAGTQTAVGFTEGRGAGDLDLEAAAAEAVTRAVRLLGAERPATGRVPVVFDPLVTAEFLSVLGDMFSAEAAQKGRSLLAGRLGEQVAAPSVSIVDDGRLAGGPASAPVDDEGVPTGRTVLVDGGVLARFLHCTETAAREGGSARSTGNASRGGYSGTPSVAPTNLYLDGPTLAPADVLRQAGDGLYVQQVTGIHAGADAVSGEFSVGASGLRIRGGELAEPVRELTVSSSILDMLAAVAAMGDDRRFFPVRGAFAGCTLLIGEMTVAGT